MNPRPGYVYVLKDIDNSVKGVKGTLCYIGSTTRPKKRLWEWQGRLPFHVEREILLRAEDRFQLENELHRQFADKNRHNCIDNRSGWFDLNEYDLDCIRSLPQVIIEEDK